VCGVTLAAVRAATGAVAKATETAAQAAPSGVPAGATPAKSGISPLILLLVGAVAIAAIVGVVIFALNQSKSSSSPSPGGGVSGASIAVNPSTFSCSDDSNRVVVTAWLPASMSESDTVALTRDNVTFYDGTVGDGFVKQAGGRWLSRATASGVQLCSGLEPGRHTYRILDGHGNVMAAADFTGTP
jgi:hypothetical protein